MIAQHARELMDIFPDAAILPVIRKTAYYWEQYQTRPGMQGRHWEAATGIAVLPIRGSTLAIIEYDDPILKDLLLQAIPRLRDTFNHVRGDHGSFAVRFPSCVEFTSIKDDDKHERLSVRTAGKAYQVVYGKHFDLEGQGRAKQWMPTGDHYTYDGKPVITLTSDESAAFYTLLASVSPKKEPATATPATPRQIITVKNVAEYERTAANIARLADWRSDDYHEWIKVGQQIKYALGEAGFHLWENFSQRSDKYTPDGANSPTEKWLTFKGTGGDPSACKTITKWANDDDPGGKWQKSVQAKNPALTGYKDSLQLAAALSLDGMPLDDATTNVSQWLPLIYAAFKGKNEQAVAFAILDRLGCDATEIVSLTKLTAKQISDVWNHNELFQRFFPRLLLGEESTPRNPTICGVLGESDSSPNSKTERGKTGPGPKFKRYTAIPFPQALELYMVSRGELRLKSQVNKSRIKHGKSITNRLMAAYVMTAGADSLPAALDLTDQVNANLPLDAEAEAEFESKVETERARLSKVVSLPPLPEDLKAYPVQAAVLAAYAKHGEHKYKLASKAASIAIKPRILRREIDRAGLYIKETTHTEPLTNPDFIPFGDIPGKGVVDAYYIADLDKWTSNPDKARNALKDGYAVEVRFRHSGKLCDKAANKQIIAEEMVERQRRAAQIEKTKGYPYGESQEYDSRSKIISLWPAQDDKRFVGTINYIRLIPTAFALIAHLPWLPPAPAPEVDKLAWVNEIIAITAAMPSPDQPLIPLRTVEPSDCCETDAVTPASAALLNVHDLYSQWISLAGDRDKQKDFFYRKLTLHQRTEVLDYRAIQAQRTITVSTSRSDRE